MRKLIGKWIGNSLWALLSGAKTAKRAMLRSHQRKRERSESTDPVRTFCCGPRCSMLSAHRRGEWAARRDDLRCCCESKAGAKSFTDMRSEAARSKQPAAAPPCPRAETRGELPRASVADRCVCVCWGSSFLPLSIRALCASGRPTRTKPSQVGRGQRGATSLSG